MIVKFLSWKNEKHCCDFIVLFTCILLCSILVHLSRNKAEVSMFAPDMEQMHAIDHTKGEPMSVNRSVLQTIGCYWLHKIFMDRFYLGLWCLRPLLAIFQYTKYIMAVSFIGGGNWSTRRKPLTCRKLLTNFFTKCCIYWPSKGRAYVYHLLLVSTLRITVKMTKFGEELDIILNILWLKVLYFHYEIPRMRFSKRYDLSFINFGKPLSTCCGCTILHGS